MQVRLYIIFYFKIIKIYRFYTKINSHFFLSFSNNFIYICTLIENLLPRDFNFIFTYGIYSYALNFFLTYY